MTSPAAAIGMHGGHTETLSADILPAAFSTGTVFLAAKKASRGDIARSASGTANCGGLRSILGHISLSAAWAALEKSSAVLEAENISTA